MHRDCLGQLIKVGSRVLWSAHNSHAGFEKGIMEVVSESPKRIRVVHGPTGYQSSVDPRSVVVVDLILSQQRDQPKTA